MTDHQPAAGARPMSTARLDDELRVTVARWMRLRWILTMLVAAILVAAAIIGGILLHQQQDELTASCGLYHDIGQLEVKPTPPLHKVGQVTVVIVIDARKAFIGQCAGTLNPATPSLVYWARQYRLAVPAPLGRPQP
jgi:hypothetical protein